MGKTKTKEIALPVLEVNENILNIITPCGIDFGNGFINSGESSGKIFYISKYPQHADFGWLSTLCSLEGTITCLEYRYTSPDRMESVMNKRISELKGSVEAAKEETEKQKIKQGIEDLTQMITRISVKNEPVGYVNIMLFPQAANANLLEARIKRIRNTISAEECGMSLLKFRQDLAYRAISPYGIPDRDNVSNMGERNMPLSSFLGGFPMADCGLNDAGGYFIGKSKNNRIVILNQWLREKDRVNSNWFITGVPGVGKSTAVKTLLMDENTVNHTKIIVFDPQREYVDLAQDPMVNGNVINGAGGEQGRLNPLQVRTSPKLERKDTNESDETDDCFIFDEEQGSSDLSLYIQQLRVFFMEYFGKDDFTFDIKANLEKNLIELYSEHGITWETDVSKLKAEDFPIMEELYDQIEKKSLAYKEEENTYLFDVHQKLCDLLFSAAKGADAALWNGYTTLQTDADFTVIDCFQLLDLDDNVKRAQFHNLTSWGWGEVCKDPEEKILLAFDEGYLFVDPESPYVMKFIRNIAKQARKFEGAIMFITHSLTDVLDESVKRFGQALIDTACYKFIMGTDGKNLQETKELLKLSAREETILSRKNRGQGILFCGGTRIDLNIVVPDEFLSMFGKAGGR